MMGHHLTDDGQFKSDRHPDLPAGKIVLSFRDPHAQLGLWVTAIDYRAHDPELSADMVTALSRLGSAPPRAAVEDAWAWALAREHGLDPRETVRVFVQSNHGGFHRLHIVGSESAVDAVLSVIDAEQLDVEQHRLVGEADAPPRAATDDGRPDFDGFLLALRAEGHWSAALHAEDRTGQAAADQRALHELAQHVEAVGKRLGFLPVTRPCGSPGVLVKNPSPHAKALAEWLRHTANVVGEHAEGREALGHVMVRTECVDNLRAAAALLDAEPLLQAWLRNLAERVAGRAGARNDTDAAPLVVANLRAAADALEGGVNHE